ncbi:UNVERIFIED_ORG: hypothetical protein J2Y84_004736 [Pseudomonas reinekei]|nr:hypothetical protein [Pseudomonas reinekei]
MVVNDNECFQDICGAFAFIAGKPAPTPSAASLAIGFRSNK